MDENAKDVDGVCDTDAHDVASALGQHYRPTLIRYFRRHLDSADDAEDLAQEALVRLLRTSTSVENTEAYLLRIASNLLRDRYRRERSRHATLHVPFDESAQDWPSEVPGSERVYEGRERLRHFLRTLDELPPRCRKVFLLQRYEGLTYGAIAKRMEISVSAVEKHMMRALMHFDARLASHERT